MTMGTIMVTTGIRMVMGTATMTAMTTAATATKDMTIQPTVPTVVTWLNSLVDCMPNGLTMTERT